MSNYMPSKTYYYVLLHFYRCQELEAKNLISKKFPNQETVHTAMSISKVKSLIGFNARHRMAVQPPHTQPQLFTTVHHQMFSTFNAGIFYHKDTYCSSSTGLQDGQKVTECFVPQGCKDQANLMLPVSYKCNIMTMYCLVT